MVVLGADPGIANTGLGVVWRSSSKYQLLASELVKSEAKEAKAERLLGIYDAVSRLLDQYECELVAVEKCYHKKMYRVASLLRQ